MTDEEQQCCPKQTHADDIS